MIKKILLGSLIALLPLVGRADQCGQVQVNAAPHTANGFVRQGCRGLTFFCGSGATCTVAGMTLAASATVNIPIPACTSAGDVSYTVSGGTLFSLEVR